jgi:hypothetical protein
LLATVYYLEDGLRASHRFVWGCVMRDGNKISFPPYLLLVQEPLSAQLQIRMGHYSNRLNRNCVPCLQTLPSKNLVKIWQFSSSFFPCSYTSLGYYPQIPIINQQNLRKHSTAQSIKTSTRYIISKLAKLIITTAKFLSAFYATRSSKRNELTNKCK